MSEPMHNHPGAGKPGAQPARKLSCEEWEALLVDFLDGALAPGEGESFREHRKSCSSCAEMFAQAGQGREWLHFLRADPEVPVVLVAKILSQTSGKLGGASPGSELAPAVAAAPALPFWRGGIAYAGRQVAQPRLLMTAAMAFFSITLTLNIAGVRLTQIRLADLKPAALSTNLSNQYSRASGRVVAYYDHIRFFYEMEAKVREIRRDADMDTSAPVVKPETGSPVGAPQDGGRKSGGKSQGPSAPSSSQEHRAMLWGERVEAALRSPFGEGLAPAALRGSEGQSSKGPSLVSGAEFIDSSAADRAERGIA
jgi:hypothetical protein